MTYRPVPDEAIEDGDAVHVLHPWRWSEYASTLLSDRGPCVSHALRRSGLDIDLGGGPTVTPVIVTPQICSPLGGDQRLCWPLLVWQSGPHGTLRVDLRASGAGRVSLRVDGRESQPVTVSGEDTYRLEIRAPSRPGWSIAALVFESIPVEDVQLGVDMTVIDPYRLRRGSGGSTPRQFAVVSVGDEIHMCGAYTTGFPADSDVVIWPPTDLTGTVPVSIVTVSSVSLLGVEVRMLGEADITGPRIGTPTRARTPQGAVSVHTERYAQSVDLVSCMTCEPIRIEGLAAFVVSRLAQTPTRQLRVGRCAGDGADDRVAHEVAVLLHATEQVEGDLVATVLIDTDEDDAERTGVEPAVLPSSSHVRSAVERGWGHSTWGGADLPTVGELSDLSLETLTIETDDADDEGPALCTVELVDGSGDPIDEARFVALGIAVRRE